MGKMHQVVTLKPYADKLYAQIVVEPHKLTQIFYDYGNKID